MPLAISPDGKGWVRVPPPRRRKPTGADRNDFIKSPLAYFACTAVPPPKPRIPDFPVYHLDPNEHTPASSHKTGRRSASNPHHSPQQQYIHPYDEEFDAFEASPVQHRSPATRSTISHERVRPQRHTPGAVAAAVAATASRAPAPKQRAVTSASSSSRGSGSAGYTYWTGPSERTRAPARSAGGGGAVGGGSSVSARWANATAPLAL